MFIIIGASSFIGVYTATHFIEQGEKIVVTGRNNKFKEYYDSLGAEYINLDLTKPEDFEKGKILDKSPSNIDVKYLIDKYKKEPKISNEKILLDSFLSWVSSIYQFILDLEIEDCFEQKNIFSNIYPQKNGVPIYNKNGHYVVKLYFMGIIISKFTFLFSN